MADRAAVAPAVPIVKNIGRDRGLLLGDRNRVRVSGNGIPGCAVVCLRKTRRQEDKVSVHSGRKPRVEGIAADNRGIEQGYRSRNINGLGGSGWRLDIKAVRVVAGREWQVKPIIEIESAVGHGLERERDLGAIHEKHAAKFRGRRGTHGYIAGTRGKRSGREETERLQPNVTGLIDRDGWRIDGRSKRSGSALNGDRVRRRAQIVPSSEEVRGTVAKSSLRAGCRCDRVRRTNRPGEGRGRRHERRTVYGHRKSWRVGDHGHLRGRGAIETLYSINISRGVTVCVAERHARRNRFDHRKSQLREIEGGVFHDRSPVEESDVLRVEGNQREIAGHLR
jgi:hypothetical protein